MNSLEDAWRWYAETKRLLRVVRRLADRHWHNLPWDESELGKDEIFKTLVGPALVTNADFGLAHLDDLAVVALFSVFESLVRQKVGSEVRRESRSITHPVLVHAANVAAKELERGSFSKVLDSLKTIDPDLVEQVRQVRRYRNWVSHGRRGPAPFKLHPRAAFDRLSAFLARLDQP